MESICSVWDEKTPLNFPPYSNQKSTMIKNQTTFILLAIVLLSCDTGDHSRTYHLPKIKTSNNLHQIKDITIGPPGFTWEKPDSWIPSRGSSMRLASFEVPFSTGSGDLSIIELSGDGGGLMANVNRWRGQVGLRPLIEAEIKAQAQTGESELEPYQFFRLINNSNSDAAMLATILPINNSTLYIKLTANADGILELEKDFKAFCSSMKRDNSSQ